MKSQSFTKKNLQETSVPVCLQLPKYQSTLRSFHGNIFKSHQEKKLFNGTFYKCLYTKFFAFV